MNLLKALVLYVDQGYPPENRNMGQVYRLITLGSENALDSLFEVLPARHPAKAPYSLFKQASDSVRGGVVIGLGSRLQVFQAELIKKITARDEIDLELPGQERCAYFLVTSDQDSTFDFLASLFLSFAFIKLVRYADRNCEGGVLPVPVHVLGEELTACGTIPDLSRRLSVIRSRNISMSCVFQNLAGLQNRYPQNLWQEILGNCDVQLFLGCTDPLTAEFVSSRTGLASVAVTSKAKQLGTWRISNYTPEYRETSGVGKRPVLTPDEVLRLPIDEALVIIRGKKILKVDKLDYSKHPDYSLLHSCKASAYVPEWRRLEMEAAEAAKGAGKHNSGSEEPETGGAKPKESRAGAEKPREPKARGTSAGTDKAGAAQRMKAEAAKESVSKTEAAQSKGSKREGTNSKEEKTRAAKPGAPKTEASKTGTQKIVRAGAQKSSKAETPKMADARARPAESDGSVSKAGSQAGIIVTDKEAIMS